MMYLKGAALIACLVIGILFGAANQQPAALSMFGFTTKAVPLYLLLVIAFVAGAVLAFVFNLLSGSESRSRMSLTQERIRECEKSLKEQVPQIEALRAKRDEERKSAAAASSELAEKA